MSGTKQLHWGKAVVSIAVTLVAMPLTHILARALKDGTSGVEQFYAGMGMGAVGLLMVIGGVFVKGDAKQTLLGLFGGMFYWMGRWTSSSCTMPTASARRHSSTP